MDKAEIREKITEGYIRVNVLFEIIGNPKEHVENALKNYLENIKLTANVIVLKEDMEEAEDLGNGLFSTFAEVDMLLRGLEKLTWLCFNYSPASIEIIDPPEFKFKEKELSNWLNDLLAKLHEIGSLSKQVSAENKLIVQNMNRLIKNSILSSIDQGFHTPKAIEERTGIDYKQLKPFFEAMIKEGKIHLMNDQYKRVGNEKKSEKKTKKK
ncbi:MAG TPA: hypothetical protein VJG90_00550 [Candidatus Nanoarchaeia archaeon]|nr:hypothetical protein [Candidatus Nanoarchaeia archaeon]